MRVYDIRNAGAKHRFMVNGRVVSNCGRLVQVQNLPRNYIEPIEVARDIAIEGDIEKLSIFYDNIPDTVSQLIRTAFVPAQGNKFVVTDFSAIEARVLAWMAGEQWVMDVFATTGKIYEATAAQMFGVPADRIKKGNPEYELRQRGKVAQLACGYQGGAGAMERMDIKHAIDPDQYPELVERWRNANPNIVKYWYTCQNAAINAMKYRETFKAGPVTFQHEDDGERDYLTVLLPSGRKLFYPRPFLSENRWGGESLGFWGQNQTTKKWEKQETYGGKLVENCIAKGTQVLTDHGWKTIETITAKDQVWDGTEFVTHGGLISKGVQKVIGIDGVWMTPEHKVLCEKEWVRANETEGHYRYEGAGVSNPPRVPFGTPLRPAGRYAEVFDIADCGQRHRFCVLGNSGMLIVHNCTQAIARDCLVVAMKRLEDAGFPIVMHIHDEVVLDCPQDKTLDDANAIMAKPISWAPGLLLKGAGFESKFYMKD